MWPITIRLPHWLFSDLLAWWSLNDLSQLLILLLRSFARAHRVKLPFRLLLLICYIEMSHQRLFIATSYRILEVVAIGFKLGVLLKFAVTEGEHIVFCI